MYRPTVGDEVPITTLNEYRHKISYFRQAMVTKGTFGNTFVLLHMLQKCQKPLSSQ